MNNQLNITKLSQPLISIVVPTFNRKGMLTETIQSILSQTYANIELIIVDNNSSDGTEIYVRSLSDKRIKYYRNENHGIIAVNRNFGMRQSSGSYIAFCDDDDTWVSNKIEIQLNAFNTNNGLLAISSNGYSSSRGKLQDAYRIKDSLQPSFREMLKKTSVINSSVLMRKEVVDYIGYIDEDAEIRASEDFDYWLRVLHYRDRSILVLKDKLVTLGVHDSNMSNTFCSYKKGLARNVEKIYKKYPEYDQGYLKTNMKYLKTITAISALNANNIGIADFLSDVDVAPGTKIITVLKYYIKKIIRRKKKV